MGRACDRCGRANRDGRQFCGGCGAPLPLICPACGFDNEADDKFCGGCGAQLGQAARARGELRHVVVLFADLEDFTGLSGRLEAEEVHRLLGRLFHEVDGAVTDCGGTIDKHIGDNVMALFGAPVAHGNDAQRAVRAALAIHERVAALSAEVSLPLAMHIGIAAGQVMASGLGSSHHHEYTVIGSSVNLAARLQAKAGGGETLVDDSVFRAVAHTAEAEAAGELSLKGIDEPVLAWRVVAMRDAPTAPRRPIIGRDGECASLRRALERTRETDRGAIVAVRGEAGIGKSRLAQEAATVAGELGYARHHVALLDFGPADAAIARFLRGLIAPAWLDKVGEEEPLRHAHLCALLGEEIPRAAAAQYEALDNANRTAGRRDAIVAAAAHAAAERPCLLTVEDAHWATDSGRRLIEGLAAATERAPAVLLVTTRPDPDGTTVDLGEAETLELGPLRGDDSAALAAALGGDEAVARLAVERAGGNPLYLEELVSTAREGRDPSAVPGNVHALVLSRLDRLAAADRDALQVASVLGLRFEIDMLRAALDDPGYEPVEPVRRGLLSGSDDELAFRHALIRDGVYASITREQRRELHQRIAELSGVDVVARAQHLDRAEHAGAARAYLEAARALVDRFDYDSALSLLARASEIAGDDDRYDVQRARGDALREVGRPQEAAVAFAACAEAARSGVERCRAAIDQARIHRAMSEFEPALAALDRATALEPGPREQVQIHYHRASIRFAQSILDESDREARAALDLAATLDDPEWEARALSALGDVAWGLGDIAEARDAFARSLEIADAHGLTRFAIPNRVMHSHTLLWTGDIDAARRATERAIATAAGIRDSYSQMFALHTMGMVRKAEGDIDGAIDVVTRALALAEELRAHRFHSEILAQYAELEIDRGGDGLALARESVDVARKMNVMDYVGPWCLGVLARLTPDADESRALRAEAEAMIARGSYCINRIVFHAHAAYAARRHGEIAAFERHRSELERIAAEHGAGYWDADLQALRAD